MLLSLFPMHYIQSGQTPLWSASLSGHQKCVELLIVAGANVDMQCEVSVSSCMYTHTSEYTDCSLTMSHVPPDRELVDRIDLSREQVLYCTALLRLATNWP